MSSFDRLNSIIIARVSSLHLSLCDIYLRERRRHQHLPVWKEGISLPCAYREKDRIDLHFSFDKSKRIRVIIVSRCLIIYAETSDLISRPIRNYISFCPSFSSFSLSTCLLVTRDAFNSEKYIRFLNEVR